MPSVAHHPIHRASGDFYEFGPFVLDPAGHSLYRSGDLVPLSPKVFEILLLLIENGGRVVRKSEILDRVWPGISVEEGSIAQNVSVLRKALDPWLEGASAIGTVARVGYRLNVEVRLRNAHAEIELIAPALAAGSDVAVIPALPEASAAIAVRNSFRSRSHLWILVTAFLSVALAILISTRLGKAHSGPRRSLAVLSLRNLDSNAHSAWLSTALTETLAAELGAGGTLRAIPGDSVLGSQRDLAIVPGAISADQRDALHRNLGCDLILTGSYLDIAGKVRVDVSLIDAASGQLIGVVSTTDREENLLDLVARAGVEMRSRLRIETPSGSQEAAIRASISSNAEAAQSYFEGLDQLRQRETPEALLSMRKAVAVDPRFALAHSALASAMTLLGKDGEAAVEAKKAFDLSAALPREDRMSIEALYYQSAYQWTKAGSVWRELWDLFPDNIEYGLNLGTVQFDSGAPHEIQTTLARLRLLPEPLRSDPRIDFLEASAFQMLGNFTAAKAANERALKTAHERGSLNLQARALIKKAASEFNLSEFDAALTDTVAARQLFADLGDREGTIDALRYHSLALRSERHLEDSLSESNLALDEARQLGYERLIARILTVSGATLRMMGRLDEAELRLTEAARLCQKTGDRILAAETEISLGAVLKQKGDFAGAAAALGVAIRSGREIGNRDTVASAVNNLGTLEMAEGEIADAQRNMTEAVKLAREVKSGDNLATSLGNLARIAELKGDFTSALSSLNESCAIREKIGQTGPLASCRIFHSLLLAESGNKTAAKAELDSAMAVPLTRGGLLALDWARVAELRIERGDLAGAEEAVDKGRLDRKKRDYIPEQDLPVELAGAKIESARGNRQTAVSLMEQVRSKAERAGLKVISLEAGLASAQTQGAVSAPEVQQAAERSGLLLIASRARKLPPR